MTREMTPSGFVPALVVCAQRDRYRVLCGTGELEAEITGNLRFSARSRDEFPVVGDRVLISLADADFAVIHEVLPRRSAIRRKAPGADGDAQIIAANVDCALVVQAAERGFSLNRVERYVALCGAAGVKPVIAITKTDLFDEEFSRALLARVGGRFPRAAVIGLSSESGLGYDALRALIESGQTWCLLGPSGAGKSTLLNRLLGEERAKTGETSGSTGKGKHTTTWRELVFLEGGGIFIDNPGMREVGLTDDGAGPDGPASAIGELAALCRFSDCSHVAEKGCAVLASLERGELDPEAYANFLRMEKERAFFALSAAARRKKDKDFGRSLKRYHRETDGRDR